MDSARALIARGWGVSLVSRCLRVSRAQLHVILRRTDDWKDGRRSRHSDDMDVLLRIYHVIGELPTYGYRRVWALLRRQAELDGMPAINAKRVYRIMRQNALLLERKPAVPPSKRAHTGRVAVKESNQRWCSDGFEFRCDNGEKLRVTFALDCVHHIWCPLFSQEFQDLPDGAETTLTVHQKVSSIFFHPSCGRTTFLHRS